MPGKRGTDLRPRKRKAVRRGLEIVDEVRERMEQRGQDPDHLVATVAGDIADWRRSQAEAEALVALRGALERVASCAVGVSVIDAARAFLAEWREQLELADWSVDRVGERAALVEAFDGELSMSEIADISFLCGIAKVQKHQENWPTSKLREREAATLSKLRERHGQGKLRRAAEFAKWVAANKKKSLRVRRP